MPWEEAPLSPSAAEVPAAGAGTAAHPAAHPCPETPGAGRRDSRAPHSAPAALSALRTDLETGEDVLRGGRGRDTSTHPRDEGWEGWMDRLADEGAAIHLSERAPGASVPSPLNRTKSSCLLELV